MTNVVEGEGVIASRRRVMKLRSLAKANWPWKASKNLDYLLVCC